MTKIFTCSKVTRCLKCWKVKMYQIKAFSLLFIFWKFVIIVYSFFPSLFCKTLVKMIAVLFIPNKGNLYRSQNTKFVKTIDMEIQLATCASNRLLKHPEAIHALLSLSLLSQYLVHISFLFKLDCMVKGLYGGRWSTGHL